MPAALCFASASAQPMPCSQSHRASVSICKSSYSVQHAHFFQMAYFTEQIRPAHSMVSTLVSLQEGHRFHLWPSDDLLTMCFMTDFKLDCLQAVLNLRTNFVTAGGCHPQDYCHTHNKGPECMEISIKKTVTVTFNIVVSVTPPFLSLPVNYGGLVHPNLDHSKYQTHCQAFGLSTTVSLKV